MLEREMNDGKFSLTVIARDVPDIARFAKFDTIYDANICVDGSCSDRALRITSSRKNIPREMEMLANWLKKDVLALIAHG